jgi:hypothetical protein
MTSSFELHLRGPSTAARGLVTTTTGTTAGTADGNADNESFLFLLTIIVGLICLFYMACTYQLVRRYLIRKCCVRGDPPVSDTVVVHDGRVFNLLGNQRRAVLEAIFSETSKVSVLGVGGLWVFVSLAWIDVVRTGPLIRLRSRLWKSFDNITGSVPHRFVFLFHAQTATDLDVSHKKKKKRNTDNEGEVPYDVEIPAMSTDGTEEESTNPPSSPDRSTAGSSSNNDEAYSEALYAMEGNVVDSSGCSVDFDSDDEDDMSVARLEVRLHESAVSMDGDKERAAVCDGNLYEESADLPRTPVDSMDSVVCLSPSSCSDTQGPPKAALRTFGSCSSDPIDDAVLSPEHTPVRRTMPSGCNDQSVNSPGSIFDKEDYALSADLSVPDLSSASDRSRSFAIPEHEAVEESPEGIEENDCSSESPSDRLEEDLAMAATIASLRHPFPLTSRESFTTVASEYTYDDDSCTTGDNLCPICLCGYKKGDSLIVANHCSHMFHKDCILEWLDAHDDCPICRTGMVTDVEMNLAATNLVGKARMYRAVASLRPASTQTPPSGARPSPFQGTVRRAASSRSPYQVSYL